MAFAVARTVCAGLLVTAFVGAVGVFASARFLSVEDELKKSDAVVVLAGGYPAREVAAAALYKAGWAPRVVLVDERAEVDRLATFRSIGMDPVPAIAARRATLESGGVPRDRIWVADESADSPWEELAVAHRLIGADADRVIIVAGTYQTRAASLVWGRLSQAVSAPPRTRRAADRPTRVDRSAKPAYSRQHCRVQRFRGPRAHESRAFSRHPWFHFWRHPTRILRQSGATCCQLPRR